MSIITIIAYKENGYHSFRGHVSEQWESELVKYVTDNTDDAILWLSKMKANSQNQKLGKFEFTVFVNGIDNDCWYFESDDDENLYYKIIQESDKLSAQYIEAERLTKLNEEERLKSENEKARKMSELNALKRRLDSETLRAEQSRLLELEKELGDS